MSYDDTSEARRRFYALANQEQAKRGLPPIQEPEPELPPSMRKFLGLNRQGATEAFIQANAERINRGELPVGSNGLPIVPPVATAAQPEAPTQDDPGTDAFFRGAANFDGSTPAGHEGVKVRRFRS